MKSGYKILWTQHALEELQKTIKFLQTNWTSRDLRNFAEKLDHSIELISKNPELFPFSESKKIRKAVITKHNVLYYRVKGDTVEILSIFSTRQDPGKRNI